MGNKPESDFLDTGSSPSELWPTKGPNDFEHEVAALERTLGLTTIGKALSWVRTSSMWPANFGLSCFTIEMMAVVSSATTSLASAWSTSARRRGHERPRRSRDGDPLAGDGVGRSGEGRDRPVRRYHEVERRRHQDRGESLQDEGVVAFAAGAASIAGELDTIVQTGKTTLSDIEQIDASGELKTAIENDSTCQSLTSSSDS